MQSPKKVLIDGSSGTTGLRIADRLKEREDIELIHIPDALRRDPDERKKAMQAADIVFLCLPDDASREASAWIGEDTVVIDTSTAFRVDPDWVYGFAELPGMREKIRHAHRIANPGCHASGFIALVAPLVGAGLLDHDCLLSCMSLTGYTGGGKKMIADYEDDARKQALEAPRMYALGQTHKHLPEMVHFTGLNNAPVFCPVVGAFAQGMEVVVPLHRQWLKGSPEDIEELYAAFYREGLIRFRKGTDEAGFMSAGSMAGRDDMEVTVCGSGERVLLVSRFDNLGKGASGAAIQNMNLVLGVDETTGLKV